MALILAYQVLSALGSQLADFLVYDRAGAQFPDPADLARFLAGYTAVMNIASIAFLFLVAGPLLRRFGLRLGIAANPVVLTVFAVASWSSSGRERRHVDRAAGDRVGGPDRRHRADRRHDPDLMIIAYQVLPGALAPRRSRRRSRGSACRSRSAISGVLILVLNVLPDPLAGDDRRHGPRVRGLDVARDPPLPRVRPGARPRAAPPAAARAGSDRLDATPGTRRPRDGCSRAPTPARPGSAWTC